MRLMLTHGPQRTPNSGWVCVPRAQPGDGPPQAVSEGRRLRRLLRRARRGFGTASGAPGRLLSDADAPAFRSLAERRWRTHGVAAVVDADPFGPLAPALPPYGQWPCTRIASRPLRSRRTSMSSACCVTSSAIRCVGLVRRAEEWPWSTLACRLAGDESAVRRLQPGPLALPANWLELVNEPQTEAELEALRLSVARLSVRLKTRAGPDSARLAGWPPGPLGWSHGASSFRTSRFEIPARPERTGPAWPPGPFRAGLLLPQKEKRGRGFPPSVELPSYFTCRTSR
jgi:hypothetical protein